MSCLICVESSFLQAVQEHGMGPRGSALICGYTNYHRLLESCLADLKKKEVFAIFNTGFFLFIVNGEYLNLS